MVDSVSEVQLVYTTTAELCDAEALARQAVTEKYAACVNIIPHAIAIYEWEGRLEKTAECLLLFKTSTAKAALLTAWLQQQHPYAVPALLQAPVTASPDFFNYIQLQLI